MIGQLQAVNHVYTTYGIYVYVYGDSEQSRIPYHVQYRHDQPLVNNASPGE